MGVYFFEVAVSIVFITHGVAHGVGDLGKLVKSVVLIQYVFSFNVQLRDHFQIQKSNVKA